MDTIIAFTVIFGVILVGVLANAIYEKWQERKSR